MMEGNELNPRNRNVTSKDLIQAAVVVIYLIAVLIALYFGHKIIAGLMGFLILIFVIYSFVKMPKEDLEQVARTIKKHESTPIGKIFKYIEYISYGIIVIGILYWVIEKFSL